MKSLSHVIATVCTYETSGTLRIRPTYLTSPTSRPDWAGSVCSLVLEPFRAFTVLAINITTLTIITSTVTVLCDKHKSGVAAATSNLRQKRQFLAKTGNLPVIQRCIQ